MSSSTGKTIRIPPNGSGIKRLLLFVAIAIVGILAGTLTPLREIFNVETIQDFSERLGAWGPVILIGIGAVTPMLFLPRWPICFVAGMLYGLVGGTLIATVASVSGAWIHYLSARVLVSTSSERLLNRFNLDPKKMHPEKAFWVIFLLRAFPLSNSAATNVLAGAFNLSKLSYLLATFFGMIPSTLMYAAWGKLMKKPDPHFYAVAVGILLIMLLGTTLARRYLFPAAVTPMDPAEEDPS